MENKGEQEKKLNLDEQFDNLPIGGSIELPISKLKSTIGGDDWTSSHSGDISIDDGNHRYFEIMRKLRNETNFKESDLDKKMIRVRKVIPEIEW
jgi:hypothetical protein